MVAIDYDNCDDNALPASSTKASSLIPNRFYKLCPGARITSGKFGNKEYASLGQPRCGDGSNFSFFVSRPLQQLENDRKILIEFQGGGACWNDETCAMQQEMLTIPEYFDNFVGMSCSEIDYGMSHSDDTPLSMLCSKSIGQTDFREYTTIVVPYCTQDIHLGDNPNVSYDNGETYVQHVGAHNMYRTLEWVFENFSDPTNIFLTGCSAGGTAVPIAYDLLNKHYNTFLKGSGVLLPRAVNINVIMDSSVYLTPSYFLQNSFQNWNPQTIMNRIGFDFIKYKYNEQYPDFVWHHILSRGPNRDRWGFVTHSYDDVSLMFYQYMSGNGNGNGGRLLVSSAQGIHGAEQLDHPPRKMEDDLHSQWWSEINSSMAWIQSKHKNTNFFVIDGDGHCSFGLYYPLQAEGFEDWAAPIVKEDKVIGNRRPVAATFFTSVALGGMFLLAILKSHKVNSTSSNKEPLVERNGTYTDSCSIFHGKLYVGPVVEKLMEIVLPRVTKFQSWPCTAAYLLMTTIYFICMIIMQGFGHPLENPTFGPNAVGLSLFGINNPTLIIYQMEHFRLVTSSFLCSGFTTYLLTIFNAFKNVAVMEASLQDNSHPFWVFPLIAGLLSFNINLVYACFGNGASCSALALTLGLNTFAVITQQCGKNPGYPNPWMFTSLVYILGCTPLFPFDSWLCLTSGVFIGAVFAKAVFIEDQVDSSEEPFEQEKPVQSGQSVRWNFVAFIVALLAIFYVVILLRIPNPNQMYSHPFLTGCNLVYSDQIGDFVSAYAGDMNGDRERRLEEVGDDWMNGENLCAQLCVPHIAYRPAVWGVGQFSPISIEAGSCEENGYDVHVADKTFRELTITLEVQLFTAADSER